MVHTSCPKAPELHSTYAQTLPSLVQPSIPAIPPSTYPIVMNESCARDLGLDPSWLATDAGLAWMTGRAPGAPAPVSLAYSGHQFGHFSPLLGDGRAHLVGELALQRGGGPTPAPSHLDLHLKGSGRTPFSRPGSDGKAPLAACAREFVIGEALHALGIPTSRALAVLATGERIQRRGPEPEAAGIVVRVAASHLRVGTVQYARVGLGEDERRALVRYAWKRHVAPGGVAAGEDAGSNAEPELDAPEAALALLDHVVQSQARLVARWMGVGFVHGVLNTDNVALSGESIDFGPCAFLDRYRQLAVFSSIDREGRYAYGRQPGVTQWNVARLAESLMDLLDPADPNRALGLAEERVRAFGPAYEREFARVFALKLGVRLEVEDAEARERVIGVAEEALSFMEDEGADMTRFFRGLTEGVGAVASQVRDSQRLAALGWAVGDLRRSTGTDDHEAHALMASANPEVVARNLDVERAVQACARGDVAPVLALVERLRDRMNDSSGSATLEVPLPGSENFVSYCGT